MQTTLGELDKQSLLRASCLKTNDSVSKKLRGFDTKKKQTGKIAGYKLWYSSITRKPRVFSLQGRKSENACSWKDNWLYGPWEKVFNSFYATGFFLIKTSEKHQKTVQKTVFCCLQEVKKESGDMKWVNESFYNHSNWSLTVNLYVSQSNISRINKIRERSLRITYSDYHSSFADFLKKVTLYLAIIRI